MEKTGALRVCLVRPFAIKKNQKLTKRVRTHTLRRKPLPIGTQFTSSSILLPSAMGSRSFSKLQSCHYHVRPASLFFPSASIQHSATRVPSPDTACMRQGYGRWWRCPVQCSLSRGRHRYILPDMFLRRLLLFDTASPIAKQRSRMTPRRQTSALKRWHVLCQVGEQCVAPCQRVKEVPLLASTLAVSVLRSVKNIVCYDKFAYKQPLRPSEALQIFFIKPTVLQLFQSNSFRFSYSLQQIFHSSQWFFHSSRFNQTNSKDTFGIRPPCWLFHVSRMQVKMA